SVSTTSISRVSGRRARLSIFLTNMQDNPSGQEVGGSGCQPSEYLHVGDVLRPPRPAVAQVRELLLHGEHAGDAHGQDRRAIERHGLLAEGSWREQPVGESP